MALYHAEEAGLIHNVDEDEPPQEVDHLVVLVICRRIVKQDIQLASQCANFGQCLNYFRALGPDEPI